jgi:hypothetical protein
LNLYKTIPTLKLSIALSAAFFFSFSSFAQQPAARNKDSAIVNSNDSKPVNLIGNIKLAHPLFPKATFLANRFKLTDTLKKNPIMRASDKLRDQLSAYNNLFREISGDMKRKMESPFSFNEGSLSLLGLSSNINNDSLDQNNYNLFDANISGNVIGIPYSALYQNHYYPFIPDGNQNRLSFQYDRNSYLDQMKKSSKENSIRKIFCKRWATLFKCLKALQKKHCAMN